MRESKKIRENSKEPEQIRKILRQPKKNPADSNESERFSKNPGTERIRKTTKRMRKNTKEDERVRPNLESLRENPKNY